MHTGPSDHEVFIQATSYSGLRGSPENIRVSYTQNTEANTITVTAEGQTPFFDWGKVTFEVTVPRTAVLQLKTDTGSIEVTLRMG